MTTFAGINYWAVLLAAIASFVFGGVWYGVLSKQWMAAAGKTPEQIKDRGNMAVPMVITAGCQVLMAYMLAGVIGHMSGPAVTFRSGVISAFFIWLGFVATTLVVNHTFQAQPRELTLIDGAHWLGVLIIQGGIIGLMGVR
jgi:hypothetical protein